MGASLIPLCLNPLEWNKDLLFKLNVKNDTNELDLLQQGYRYI